MAEPKQSQERGISEALRTAIERTFAASADSASQTRDRAQELLDEVSRRGHDAREASAGAAARVIEAIEGMRLASREEVRALERQVEALGERVAQLEQLANRIARLEAKAKVEG